MKKYVNIMLASIMMFVLTACGNKELADMATEVNDDYASIVWEDKTYVPYCVLSKKDCGKQIGIVDGDKEDKVYEYKGYSADEWIITSHVHDGSMLYKEINVSNIPDGLESEYEWNNEMTVIERAEADAMWDRIPMVRVNDKLYYDTGRESTAEGRCGNMDGQITSEVDGSEIPTENDQSNFGTGFGYQYGKDDTLEIYMNEKWFVFECREEQE